MSVSPSSSVGQPYVKIEFSPISGCLGSIVGAVTDFCRNVVDDPKVQFAFQMAAHELTENLVKYSSGDTIAVQIAVEDTARGPELVLTTENQASPERLTDVASRLDAAENATDPILHFDRLVQDSLETPNESGLGLGRLRAEGGLEVSHQIVGRTIRIQVRHPVAVFQAGVTR